MAKQNVSGSAILIVMLLSAILLSSLCLLWRTVSYSHETALSHYQAIKQTYLAEGLLIYGLALLKDRKINLAQIKKVDQTMIIFDGTWPSNGSTQGVLQIRRLPAKDQFLLTAKLVELKQAAHQREVAAVTEVQANKITILSWKK